MASSLRAQSSIGLLLCLSLVIFSIVSARTTPACTIAYKQKLGVRYLLTQCKDVLESLGDAEAAACLCSAIKDGLYGPAPISGMDGFMREMLALCNGRKAPDGYKCTYF